MPVILVVDLLKLTPSDGTYYLYAGAGEVDPKGLKASYEARQHLFGSGRTVVACTPKTDAERRLIHRFQASRALAMMTGFESEALQEVDMAWQLSDGGHPQLAAMRAVAYKRRGRRAEACRWYQWTAERERGNFLYRAELEPDCVTDPTERERLKQR